MDILAYGIDYARFAIESSLDVKYIQRRLEYVDVDDRWYHGVHCVNLSGNTLSLIRMVENVCDVLSELSCLYETKRLDVFVDVAGDVIGDASHPGTTIANDGHIETVYSTRIKRRGNVATFARMYDAKKAGHYEIEATRFECEYKQHKARAVLSGGRFVHNPVSIALFDINAIYGIDITIPGVHAVEFNPPKQKIRHGRERFYERYGKNIARDVEEMGLWRFLKFVYSCIGVFEEEADNDNVYRRWA